MFACWWQTKLTLGGSCIHICTVICTETMNLWAKVETKDADELNWEFPFHNTNFTRQNHYLNYTNTKRKYTPKDMCVNRSQNGWIIKVALRQVFWHGRTFFLLIAFRYHNITTYRNCPLPIATNTVSGQLPQMWADPQTPDKCAWCGWCVSAPGVSAGDIWVLSKNSVQFFIKLWINLKRQMKFSQTHVILCRQMNGHTISLLKCNNNATKWSTKWWRSPRWWVVITQREEYNAVNKNKAKRNFFPRIFSIYNIQLMQYCILLHT